MVLGAFLNKKALKINIFLTQKALTLRPGTWPGALGPRTWPGALDPETLGLGPWHLDPRGLGPWAWSLGPCPCPWAAGPWPIGPWADGQ